MLPRIWPFKHGIWINPTSHTPNNYSFEEKRRDVCDRLDTRVRFDWQVYWVSASGFFTDSYALFATNVILPSLGYLYWPENTSNKPELTINCVTLFGSLCGQVLFGFLADLYGRRRLYGLELVMVIFATMGMAQASSGVNESMNVMGWIVFWRFFIGVGIGAEYPLSAVIAAEFAGVDSRARMMAAVFMMQPIGQLAAALVGWTALVGIGRSRGIDKYPADGNKLNDEQKFVVLSAIDTIWRCVIGVGAFPALIAIIYRLTIPESPRYTLDVIMDGDQALSDLNKYQAYDATTALARRQISAPIQVVANGGVSTGYQKQPEQNPPVTTPRSVHQQAQHHPRSGAVQMPIEPSPTVPNYFTYAELHGFFWRDGNIRYLAATSLCWFLLDFAFYGLGIGSPRQIAAIWAASNETSIAGWPHTRPGPDYATFANGSFPSWQNPFDPNTNIYQQLFNNAFKYTITISIGSITGSILMILLINRIKRKMWLVRSFMILSILFAVTGGTLRHVQFGSARWITIVFYVVCQLFFNFGPNTLTYIIPAEIFPTKYRCTCHGISAGCGKAGSLFVQLVLSHRRFGRNPGDLGFVLGIFSLLMALGAFVAWVWLPELQGNPAVTARAESWPFLPNKSLETLAKGFSFATAPHPDGEEQIIGLRASCAGFWSGVKRRWVAWRARRHPRQEAFGMGVVNGGVQRQPQQERFGAVP